MMYDTSASLTPCIIASGPNVAYNVTTENINTLTVSICHL